MNGMDKTSTITIVGLLIVAVVFVTVLLFLMRNNVGEVDDTQDVTPGTDWTTAPAAPSSTSTKDVFVTPKTVVTAKHAYRNGAHIIAGEIPLPPPCHLLETKGPASAFLAVKILKVPPKAIWKYLRDFSSSST